MMAKWRIGIAAAGAAILIVILLTEGVLIPKQLQPNMLPIRLASVTTTEGVRRAVYELRNESRSKVDVWAAASLNVGNPDKFEIQHTHIKPVSIEAGQSAQIFMTVPEDQGWQAMLRVARHGAQDGTVVFSEWSTDQER